MSSTNHPFMRSPGQAIPLIAVETQPDDVVLVTEDTEVELREEPISGFEKTGGGITYEDIGGLQSEIQRVREMVELPMKHPQIFQKLGIEPPQGVLLHGPPGTGKTLLAKAVANETSASFFSIAGPEIISKYYGESEQQLREIFEDASEEAPSIIFIDELDSIAPKREDVTGEVERRVVAQLLTMMDGLESRGQVIVIAATNRVDSVDPALRRPGRFDREIEIGVPDERGREEILQIHTRGMPLSDDVSLSHLADETHGFVGADVESLTKESAMKALRRYLPEIDLDEESIPPSLIDRMIIKREDFEGALGGVDPSAMREVLVELPKVTWNDVGGLDQAKEEIKESVEWPLIDPRALLTARDRTAGGRAALRAARHGEDPDGEGGRQRDQRQLHLDPGPTAPLEVGRRVRESHPTDVQEGSAGLSDSHLLRRARQPRPRPRWRRRLERLRARGEPAPHRTGWAGGHEERDGDRRHQPTRT